MEEREFWRDEDMDSVIKNIILIFNQTEGVELVRLNGLTKYLQKNMDSLSVESVETIIRKLKEAEIINYELVLHCPFCQETSFILKDFSTPTIKKLCDTCVVFDYITKNETLE